ncbi:glycosyltransferase family 10 fucosyltransferase [Prosthecomicrobium pneumaticum]|uniref:Alpha-1,3-fucosyltransferase n=1 Tax=Prosthecomicrobium pneumaticum TaxID=81895 RepID=A0A7W9FQ95_9HYPH|nr:glycosyltransferase family 10 fucosyltransferase [Prosthecomicrobium pneumaticum]MBB5754887.1 hypothetical protein [Prosthecomicrobium pneumaticum]
MPLILIQTGFFGAPVATDSARPDADTVFTTDRSRIAQADAVVFHLPDIVRKGLRGMPKWPGQLWVAWTMESIVNCRPLADPEVMRHFDLRMTYQRDADVWTPYLPPAEAFAAARAAPRTPKHWDRPVALFQSSKLTASGRNALLADLARHLPIDSYGAFMHNRDLPQPDRGPATKAAVIAAYPFCIAFENAIAPDYVTEKLYDPLLAGAVPIYLGAPNAPAFAPEGSYIDAGRFADMAALAAHLRRLTAEREAYEAHFRWRDRPLPAALTSMIETVRVPAFDRLAALVERRAPPVRPAGRPFYPFGRWLPFRGRLG